MHTKGCREVLITGCRLESDQRLTTTLGVCNLERNAYVARVCNNFYLLP